MFFRRRCLFFNPYKILGVSEQADFQEIKQRFRILAKENHPDVNSSPSAAEKMAEISRAYECLSDTKTRASFDKGKDFGGWHDFHQTSSMYSDFSDIFSRSKPGQSAPHQTRGEDVSLDCEVEFLDAMKGCEKTIFLKTRQKCVECRGSGAQENTSWSICRVCAGTGTQRVERGILTMGVPCVKCRGSGQILEYPCRVCSGSGSRVQKKTVNLRIPAGIKTGMELRVNKEGHCGDRGGRPGNLFVTVKVRKHEFFRHIDADLHCDIEITLKQSLLGGEIKVPTLKGDILVHLPPRTVPQEKGKTLANRGPPRVDGRSGNGHQICHFQLKLPKELTKRQIELIHEFDEIQKNQE